MAVVVKSSDRFDTPIVWLGQNLRNRVLLSEHKDLNQAPILVSLGDAYLRPTFFDRYFGEHLRETLGMYGPIMVDSGGFTLLSRRSIRIDLQKIERVYTRIAADIVVALDYPPSPKDSPAARRKLRIKTAANLCWLREVVPSERLMPVVHGYSIAELKSSCDAVSKAINRPTQIGIGGLVP